MTSRHISNAELLRRLLVRKRVADLKTLMRATGGRSQASIFRDLAKLDYLSSFTHAGRFYTLSGIPEFDEHNLWFYQGIGFSKLGTIKNTVLELLNRSQAGYFHRELESLMHVPVYNPLLDLTRAARIRRESFGPRRWLYLSADPQRAAEQLQVRKTLLASQPLPPPPIHVGSIDAVIAVLVETIQAGARLPTVLQVTQRLAMRNLSVLPEHVEQIWVHYGIDRQKKTSESRPQPSKR